MSHYDWTSHDCNTCDCARKRLSRLLWCEVEWRPILNYISLWVLMSAVLFMLNGAAVWFFLPALKTCTERMSDVISLFQRLDATSRLKDAYYFQVRVKLLIPDIFLCSIFLFSRQSIALSKSGQIKVVIWSGVVIIDVDRFVVNTWCITWCSLFVLMRHCVRTGFINAPDIVGRRHGTQTESDIHAHVAYWYLSAKHIEHCFASHYGANRNDKVVPPGDTLL